MALVGENHIANIGLHVTVCSFNSFHLVCFVQWGPLDGTLNFGKDLEDLTMGSFTNFGHSSAFKYFFTSFMRFLRDFIFNFTKISGS